HDPTMPTTSFQNQQVKQELSQCSFCPERFPDEKRLAHMTLRHPEKLRKTLRDEYRCPHCNRVTYPTNR
ncbi:hypothetical protein PFISCL1PPCAC_26605, partial [Pristionchus fissidentatus]